MSLFKPISRRRLLALAGAGLVAGCSGPNTSGGEAGTAIEILHRHHGLLRRAIAIMEEIRGGMDARMDLPPEIIQDTVGIIRQFGVEYHQKMEENFILPAFDAAQKMGGLAGVLREQHAAGSQLTEILKELAVGFSAKDLEKRRTMGSAIHQLSRMYRAHSDREETVLFPAVGQVMTQKEYEKLSSDFRKSEMEILGQNGFEKTLQQLSNYENILGIGDLATFTPRPEDF